MYDMKSKVMRKNVEKNKQKKQKKTRKVLHFAVYVVYFDTKKIFIRNFQRFNDLIHYLCRNKKKKSQSTFDIGKIKKEDRLSLNKAFVKPRMWRATYKKNYRHEKS